MTTTSVDGTPIHYREGGQGKVALFFIHGWLGNGGWWDEQLAHFAPRYRVVAMDLAGHGQSGRGRGQWTVQASADDARAVADALKLDRILWIGHSMSGRIILEAANRMPERTVGLIPVDTLHDVRVQESPEELDAFFAPMRKDFVPNTQAFFKKIVDPSSPEPALRRLMDDIAGSPPDIALAIVRDALLYDAATAMAAVKAPIVAAQSERQPTNIEGNRTIAPQFDAVTMKNVGHWPMLERPAAFNQLLQQAIDRTMAAFP